MTEIIDFKAIEKLQEIQAESRGRISHPELVASVKAVFDHMNLRDCKLFDKTFATEEDFLIYIAENNRIGYITKEVGLPKEVYGAVVRQRLKTSNGLKNFYLLVISPEILDKNERSFTIAHELGHILLHGHLLTDDIRNPSNPDYWNRHSYRLAPMMEAEANVFALFCLIPSYFIEHERVRSNLKSGRAFAKYLKKILEHKCKVKFELSLVIARIWMHTVIFEHTAKELSNDLHFSSPEGFSHIRSWLVYGLLRKEKYLNSDVQNTDPQERCEQKPKNQLHEKQSHIKQIPMERFRIEVGQINDVKASNIIDAIKIEAGLESQFINAVEIHRMYSTFKLPAGIPKTIFEDLKEVWVCGKKLQITKIKSSKGEMSQNV